MAASNAVSILNVGQNGQITIPAGFRKQHALARGGKILIVRMGQALVVAPHDAVLEAICMRLEDAMKGAGLSMEALKAQALIERQGIVRRRYGATSGRLPAKSRL